MTAEEKAKELVLKFVIVPDEAMPIDSNKAWIDKILAKQCALIAVDEIQKDREFIFHEYGIGYMGSATARKDFSKHKLYKYWEQVKEAIQIL